jgi:hypothetical protein
MKRGEGGAYPLVFLAACQQPFQRYKYLTAVFCSTPSPLPTVFLNHSSTAAFIWAMVSRSIFLHYDFYIIG